jgi:hypothetical protein
MGQQRGDDDADAIGAAATLAAPVGSDGAGKAGPGEGTKPSLLAMMECTKCHVSTPVARFCTACGTSLAPRRFCSECGVRLKPEAPFCEACGAKVP